MTREERKNVLHCLKVMAEEEVCEECDLYGTTGTDHCENDCVRMAIQALSQEPCDECRNKRTSFCGNCDDFDEFEEIDYVQEHKKIPVTLDLTPCDDAVSRQAVLDIAKSSKSNWIDNSVLFKRVNELPSITQKPIECDDVVSRQAVNQLLMNMASSAYGFEEIRRIVDDLPSVTQKQGKWNTFELFQGGIKETWYECPKCKWSNALLIPRNYCPNCGARMVEPQESEDKE